MAAHATRIAFAKEIVFMRPTECHGGKVCANISLPWKRYKMGSYGTLTGSRIRSLSNHSIYYELE